MGPGRIHPGSRGDSGKCASLPSTIPAPRRILIPLHTYIGSKSDGSGNSAPEAVTAHADTVESAAAQRLASLKAPQAPSLSWEPLAFVSDARRSSCAHASSTLPYVACRIGFLAIKTQSQPGSIWGMRIRTDSRIRRFTRFRTTARPILRLTEKPKRL